MNKMIARKSLGNALIEHNSNTSTHMSPLRKSISAHLMQHDLPIRKSPTSSSPLRRKSVVVQKALPINLSENDDEAERNALRLERSNSITGHQTNTSDKRRSLGLGFLAHMPAPQIAERMAQCIKLSTENKINVKNAFSVEIIDFMTFMIKKQDSNMSNLQVASTSLDVSTKIYGFRVDSVHTDILKMIGGLEKVEEAANDQQDKDDNIGTGEEDTLQTQVKKKKKRVAHDILSTEDSLAMNVDSTDTVSIKMRDTDTQTTDTLHQRMLPNHVFSRFYLHRYNDVVVDTEITETNEEEENEIVNEIIDIPPGAEVYPSFANFEFQGWSLEDEPEESEPEEVNDAGFHFDPDASVPDDEPPPSGINYFDIEDEQEDIDRCAKIPDRQEKIVDLCDIVTAPGPTSQISEYSFIQKSLNFHWAGPSHWKIRNFTRPLNGSKVVGACHQEKVKVRKEIELKYDDEIIEIALKKLQPSQSINLQPKTAKMDWDEAKLSLPKDVHYNILQSQRLYLIPEKVIFQNKGNVISASPVCNGNINYDYNNLNDTTEYCPAITDDNYNGCEDNNEDDDFGHEFGDDNPTGTQMALMGDNLVSAPKMVDKISIAYSLRAKKIDMKQLKKSIWGCLTSAKKKENVNTEDHAEQPECNNDKDNNRFSDVYKTLPNVLSKTNTEALSFPIAFVSLLHLANEKSLNIRSSPNMSDLLVKQD